MHLLREQVKCTVKGILKGPFCKFFPVSDGQTPRTPFGPFSPTIPMPMAMPIPVPMPMTPTSPFSSSPLMGPLSPYRTYQQQQQQQEFIYPQFGTSLSLEQQKQQQQYGQQQQQQHKPGLTLSEVTKNANFTTQQGELGTLSSENSTKVAHHQSLYGNQLGSTRPKDQHLQHRPIFPPHVHMGAHPHYFKYPPFPNPYMTMQQPSTSTSNEEVVVVDK